MRRRVIRSPASGPDVMVEPGAGGLGDYVLSLSPAVEDPYGYLSRRALAYPRLMSVLLIAAVPVVLEVLVMIRRGLVQGDCIPPVKSLRQTAVRGREWVSEL